MIRLFVGTDPQQHVAERALEASVRKNTSEPVEITWMRAGEPGWDWDDGATPFSRFRWRVPRECGYEGRAIYMDADMLALGDLGELWSGAPNGYAGRNRKKADVIVWDCEKPGLDHKLPDCWDHCDVLKTDTKILHFTRLRSQPWHPYPDRYDYGPHADPAACALFWEYVNLHSLLDGVVLGGLGQDKSDGAPFFTKGAGGPPKEVTA